jgi:hydrogenase large subunit
LAAAKNVGNAFGFNVHVNEDSNPADISKEGHLVRDVIYGSNFTASHLVHFYHLAALDFIDVASILDKPPFSPRFGPGPSAASYPYYYRIPTSISTYLVAQYVLALTFKRQLNQIGAIWGGRAPFVQGLTPGGASTSITAEAITKTKELLYGGTGYDKDNPKPGTILAFIGTPFDFYNWVADTGGNTGKLPIIGDGTYGGTMLFDVVAAAMFYAEYFWIGNAYERFLAYGVFERGDDSNPLGDKRLLSRGRKRTGQKYSAFTPPDKPPEWFPAEQEMVHESVAKSYYSYVHEGTIKWRHPWDGQTVPKPGKAGSYSWIKSPRYKDATDPMSGSQYIPYEAGPLSRMMVNGDYYAGLLYDAGYHNVPNIPSVFGPLAGAKVPEYGDMGPDLSSAWSTGGPDLSSIAYTGDSCLDRYAARQLEAYKVARAMADWLDELSGSIGAVTSTSRPIPNSANGYGWTEAPRGALGHWIKIRNGKIKKYQCVVPSTWNASPRDATGRAGPAEKAMKGVWLRNADHPLEVMRVSHSWDFCTACAVHLVSKDNGKKEEKVFKMNPTYL